MSKRLISSFLAIAAAMALTLGAAGCGSDESGGSGGSDASVDPGPGADAGSDPGASDPGGSDPGSDPGASDPGQADPGSADAGYDGPPPPFEDLKVDDAIYMQGIGGPVSIVRDDHGLLHIYATSRNDLLFAQGYAHAMDRMPQMELFRRVSKGTLSELLGDLTPSVIEDDIWNRIYGFRRLAKGMYEGLPENGESRRALEAYSRGVNVFIDQLRSGSRKLPHPFPIFLPADAMRDWTPIDTLAIGRLQVHSLSFDGDREIRLTEIYQKLRAAFPSGDPDPAKALRSEIFADLVRFAPADPTVQYEGWPPPPPVNARFSATSPPGAPRGRSTRRPFVSDRLLALGKQLHPRSALITGDPRRRGASNNWAVGPGLTKDGHAVVCNDPHLALPSPPLFHFSHLVLEPPQGSAERPIDAFGGNFPGVPGFLIGHNAHVAWVLTTSSDDRTDVYLEQFSAGAAPTVLHDGKATPVQVVEDSIQVGELGKISRTIDFKIYITAEGRVLVPKVGQNGLEAMESGEQLSYAWTGYLPSGEIGSILGALSAADADELMAVFEDFHATNQNVVGGDDKGNIFGLSPGGIPIRKPGARTWDPVSNPEGTAPWWVLPGDGSADWDGWIPKEAGPRAKNPAKGFVVTANNDHFGQTLDNNPLNDPVYLGYDYSLGFRAGRIHRLLDGSGLGSPAAGGAKLGLDEMLLVQTDTLSNVGRRLRPLLVAELDRVAAEIAVPGTHPDLKAVVEANPGLHADLKAALAILKAWDLSTPPATTDEGATPSAAERGNGAATALFNLWMVQVMKDAFGDETAAADVGIGDGWRVRALILIMENKPGTVATLDPDTGESALWDDLGTPGEKEGSAQVVAGAFFKALAKSAELFPADTALKDRVWGELHRIIFKSLLPIPGGALDLPRPFTELAGKGYGRPGDQYSVNVCNPGLGDFKFTCGSGPIMRFCADLDPSGVRAYNMIPGGDSMDPQSPYYGNLLPGWLAHEPFFWAYREADVRAQATRHTVLLPVYE